MFRALKRLGRQRIFARKAEPAKLSAIEQLESRQMLSAAATTTIMYNSKILSYAATSSSIQGYTPAQIRKAYGFDTAAFSSSATTSADGAGQTIAIIDAYNDPNIANDLKVFDSQFGLAAPPSLKVVNENGSSSLPSTDAGWSGEISLDVEWAHAIAPAANILLVEATSADTTDLMKAVDYARNAAGVSVVSMSWGGSEFFNWGYGAESASQTNYDPYFLTPIGHQGVTFVASAGDSGSQSGVQWPASSPNVLSVGGTALYTSDASGTYSTETSWSGASSGYSQVEVQPSYQNGVQNSGARSVADVSYDADPNTGFAVYDSLPDSGYSGWQEVGGTSAGAPQWAALIAIADQGRALSGGTSLDGATQTLPLLYSLYTNTAYSANFNDVVDSAGGGGEPWRWGWGGYGNSQSSAAAGYDTVTGLGSPKAAALIDTLVGSSASATGSTGSTSSGGSSGSGSGTTIAALPAFPLTAVFADAPIADVIDGQNGTLELRLTNTNGSRFTGPISVSLYASGDNALSTDDTLLTTLNIKNVVIRAGMSKVIKLQYTYPTSVSDGTYYVVGSVTAMGTNTAAGEVDALSSTSIASQKVDLSTRFTKPTITVKPGKGENVTVDIQNLGNVMAVGSLDLKLYASATAALDTTANLLATLSSHLFHIKAGHTLALHLHFIAPLGDPAGSYSLIASTSSSTSPLDSNPANDVAAASTAASA